MAVLRDLTKTLTNAELLALVAERGLANEVTKQTQVAIIQKHDAPFLSFTGNFRPYDYSVQKCKRIVETYESIKAFAESDGKKTA